MKKIYILSLLLVFSLVAFPQEESGVIRGRIVDASTSEGIPFASVVIWNTNIGAMTDFDGNFLFTGVKPGYIELRASSVGYKPFISESILVTNSNEVRITVELEGTVVGIQDVVVKASPFRKKVESPVSARIISIEEIEMNPGGNRDISRIIQSFPGVASTPAFRNDVIVRGGGPNENRFFVDNVEIPYLNHFSTQGSSGGPIGIINVDFVRSVDFLSGAFPSSRGNALSSVMNFSLIEGNSEKRTVRATVGASDLGLTFNGALNDRSSLIVSARRSYLKFLFQALELPFLPSYNDFQFKYRIKTRERSDLTLIGLGAIDNFALNLEADETEYQRYILGFIPDQEQYSYTIGAVYRNLRRDGTEMFVVSRNYLNNRQIKYFDNIEQENNKTLDYKSGEGDVRFRYENNTTGEDGFRVSYGAGTEFSRYRNDTFRKTFNEGSVTSYKYSTNLTFLKFSLFAQVSKTLLEEKMRLSFGLRTDANTYSNDMLNPLKQLSPRLSLSYSLTRELSLNFSTGRYYQLPSYTSLGYKDDSGNYINRVNNIKYTSADHLVGGVEYNPAENLQITAEAFFKRYNRYPFSVNDSVPLSTKSAGYGVFGDEELVSTSIGRAYGLEVMGRIRDLSGLNMVFAYTYVRSEFKDVSGLYIPSAWDNRNLFSMTGTKKFGRNWNVGLKWRLVGGAPYTPYDVDKSSIKDAWNLNGQGYLDYSRFNSERLKAFNQLDVRLDKQLFFKNWSLMLYLDIQNLLNHKADQPGILIPESDASGIPVTDPDDPARYLLKYIKADTGTVLPSIGIIIEI